MKYQKADPIFLNKFWKILNRLNRGMETRYNGKCEQQVFVTRTINKWFKGKYYAVIIHEATGIYMVKKGKPYSNYDHTSSNITKPVKHYVKVCGICFPLGYGLEIDISYDNPTNRLAWVSKRFDQNSLEDLEFTEISKETFDSVCSLFDDDRDN
jgi:hypothetical protein